jgi:CheY-like chemotaxis protein
MRASPARCKVLFVEDEAALRRTYKRFFRERYDVAFAASGSEARRQLEEFQPEVLVLDLRLPDISGFELLEEMGADPALTDVPVIVFTGRELSPEEDAHLRTMACSIVVKGVESPARLFDETALFLHLKVSDLPAEKQLMLSRLHDSDEDLAGKKVLLVDDDARNIFALSSVLERRGMNVLTATTGREAMAVLQSNPDLAIVLMDVMMPGKDGYETIEAIRKNPALRRLPIVALTAKAMKGDREKCLEAGASDYLAKPVNTEQLLSALRMWLHR